jgi:hypothetical protein
MPTGAAAAASADRRDHHHRRRRRTGRLPFGPVAERVQRAPVQAERGAERERDAHRHETSERRGAAYGAQAHIPASVTSRQFIERGFR